MAGEARKTGAKLEAPAGMLAMALACSFLASFAQTMVNIALPQMAERFSVTLSMANWLIVGYTVVAATTITLVAYLLGRLGLRRVFFVGAGAIALGSGPAPSRSAAGWRCSRRAFPRSWPAGSCRRWGRGCSTPR